MFKRGKKWFAWNPLTGRREATQCTDKKAAELVIAEWERRAADPTYNDASSKTLAHGAELLMVALRRADAAAATIQMYDQKIAQLGRLLGDTTSLQSLMDSDRVDAYIQTRETEGVTPSTIHKELVALRRILKHAKRKKWVRGDLDEVLPVGYSPKYEPRKTVIAVDDWSRLLDEIGYVTPQARPRDRNKPKPLAVPPPSPARAAHLAFALATGANDNECKRARRSHIDLKTGFVFIDGTKRESRKRYVPIMATTKHLIERVLRDAPGEDGELLFAPWGNMWRDLGRRCSALGMPRLTSNDLRRSFGSMLARAGVPFEVIAKLMGHKSTKMVMEVYGQLRPQDLADIVNKLVVKPGTRAGQRSGKSYNQQAATRTAKAGKRR
jgi:integrase